jgi:glycosyltransferase involved in cell wall biosynthesis
MEDTIPLISIGLPVYNEETFITETIKSVLSQTFQNFELIISDNSSTDKTALICQEFANKDSRIVFIKQEENIGAASNFKYTFEIAKGDFFVWISGHDLWDTSFLEQTFTLMQKDTTVVLCHPEAVWISIEGISLGTIGRPIETRGLDQLGRFHVALWGMSYASIVYGLIRTEALRNCSLGQKVIAPDNILLTELSLLGSFAYIPAPLQYIRKLDDYGSWEVYIKKIFNQQLSDLSGLELFGRMISTYIDILTKHVDSKYELDVMLSSTINCQFTKYAWILSALAKSEVTQSRDTSRWLTFIETLQDISSCSGESILRIHQENKNLDILQSPVILIDAVFFQTYQTGIARVWKSLLECWATKTLAHHILVLDRAGTAPRIPGILYRMIPRYSYDDVETDQSIIQSVCDEVNAAVFISSYYTIPKETPSVFMGYDMIPEVFRFDLQEPSWREKHRAIHQASSYITISENTASDLISFFPDISKKLITVAHCGVSENLGVASSDEICDFQTKYNIRKPYFLIVGINFALNNNYKNGVLFFAAFSKIADVNKYEIVCTGGGILAPEFQEYAGDCKVHLLNLTDEELKSAYSGAIALIFPSQYEGFGMPIIEAMACGCPVITCVNSSIPEVAGDAALYVNEIDILQMVEALKDIQKPDVRSRLIHDGLQRAEKFTWGGMANKVETALLEATLIHLNLREINYIVCPDWTQPEEIIAADIENVLTLVAIDESREKITLLICLDGADHEAAELILSSAAMNLMMGADIDVSEDTQVSFLSQLSASQWQVLLPRLAKWIRLQQENQRITELLKTMPTLTLN